MRKYSIVVLVVMCGVFYSCSTLREGRVSSKDYEPGRQYTQTYYLMIPSGKTYLYIPQTRLVTVPEHWVITIQGYGEEQDSHEVIYVTQGDYESLAIGDHMIRLNTETWSRKY